MNAAVYYGPGDIRIEDVPDPVCGDEDVVLKVAACGICGTDASAYEHGSIFAQPGAVLGHEFSGRVVDAGSAVRGISVGDRVTAWPMDPCDSCPRCVAGEWNLCEEVAAGNRPVSGAFAEYVRIPHARVNRTIYHLPELVSWNDGAVVEPMSVALAAVSAAGAGASDTAVVTGLGPIGLCVVEALRAAGVPTIVGVDMIQRRLTLAKELGAHHVVNPADAPTVDQLRELFGASSRGSARVDVVFECTGVAPVLSDAIQALRPAGRLALIGLPHKPPVIDIEAVCLKQLVIRGTFAYRTEYASTIAMLADGRLDVRPMVTHEVALTDAVEGFEIQKDREQSIKVMVVVDDAV